MFRNTEYELPLAGSFSGALLKESAVLAVPCFSGGGTHIGVHCSILFMLYICYASYVCENCS